MELKQYFEEKKGLFILSTADDSGSVNGAVYSTPHLMDDGTLAIIMNNKKTHQNVDKNPHAHLLFIEEGPGYKGKRLTLKKVREEQDSDLLYKLCKRCADGDPKFEGKTRFLVFFSIEDERPLVGAG